MIILLLIVTLLFTIGGFFTNVLRKWSVMLYHYKILQPKISKLWNFTYKIVPQFNNPMANAEIEELNKKQWQIDARNIPLTEKIITINQLFEAINLYCPVVIQPHAHLLNEFQELQEEISPLIAQFNQSVELYNFAIHRLPVRALTPLAKYHPHDTITPLAVLH